MNEGQGQTRSRFYGTSSKVVYNFANKNTTTNYLCQKWEKLPADSTSGQLQHKQMFRRQTENQSLLDSSEWSTGLVYYYNGMPVGQYITQNAQQKIKVVETPTKKNQVYENCNNY